MSVVVSPFLHSSIHPLLRLLLSGGLVQWFRAWAPLGRSWGAKTQNRVPRALPRLMNGEVPGAASRHRYLSKAS